MTTQSSNPQDHQKMNDWWQKLPADQKRTYQDNFQNKNAPTDEELRQAYNQSGQGSQNR